MHCNPDPGGPSTNQHVEWPGGRIWRLTLSWETPWTGAGCLFLAYFCFQVSEPLYALFTRPFENIPSFPCPHHILKGMYFFLSTEFLICCCGRRMSFWEYHLKTILSTHGNKNLVPVLRVLGRLLWEWSLKGFGLKMSSSGIGWDQGLLLDSTHHPIGPCPTQGGSQEILVDKHMTTQRHKHKITSEQTALLVLCQWLATKDKIRKSGISLASHSRRPCLDLPFPHKRPGASVPPLGNEIQCEINLKGGS